MDWFKKLFIDEAKPALERHSGSGGSGGANVEVCDVEFYSEIEGEVIVVFTYFEDGVFTTTSRSYTGFSDEIFSNVVCNSALFIDTSSEPSAIPYTFDNCAEVTYGSGYSVYEIAGHARIEVLVDSHLGGGPGDW